MLEVNEAFAGQYLGCEKELGLNREITNVNGSGIGLGHPVGSTGCRIMVTLIHAMRKHGKPLDLQPSAAAAVSPWQAPSKFYKTDSLQGCDLFSELRGSGLMLCSLARIFLFQPFRDYFHLFGTTSS